MKILDRGLVSIPGLIGRWVAQARSSSLCGSVARQQILHGPRGMSMEVAGSRCSIKMVKNKIEFYNIIKIGLKVDL